MSGRIRLLPDTVANQIAAGEVVNRPASVVKEMMENAVDAEAGSVTVNYRGGGKELIHVIDDGSGMSPADARLAFDKHATSKITGIEDVYRLSTFGFRGEALASIAAIASVELITRQAEDELGTKVVIEGSKFLSQEMTVSPKGSQFLVKNLFFNVPARRRVLDKSTTEHRHIAEEFKRVALCHPGIAFSLYGEDAPIYTLQPSNLRHRIAGLAGKSVTNNLLDVCTDTSIVKIKGFTGTTSSAKQNNREQYLFVNGRFFKSPYFHKAIIQAYEKLIPANTQPSYFLYLEVDPDKVDVNIHPQKIEVRFEEGVAIWQIISAAVREALAKTGAVSLMDFDEDKNVEIPVLPRGNGEIRVPRTTTNPSYNPFGNIPDKGTRSRADVSDFTMPYSGNLENITREAALGKFDESVLEFIDGEEESQARLIEDDYDNKQGELKGVLPLSGAFIATSRVGKLVIIDLQRAKEAILYERYVTMFRSDTSVSQKLLFPEIMVFSLDDIALLKEKYDDFNACGFEYVIAGDNKVEIYGIPADFSLEDIEALIYDMIDCLGGETGCPADVKREYLASILSRNGSKRLAGSYTEGEITAILESFNEGGRYAFTPDGKPVIAEVGYDQIRKLFIR